MSPEESTPYPTPDRDSEPFWTAINNGELQLQKCEDCETLRWPPRAICNRCASFAASWQPTTGRGALVSWIRTHQVFAPAYRDRVPYLVVQVALEEQRDILLIGGWRDERDPIPGEPVAARFTETSTGQRLLDWAPAE